MTLLVCKYFKHSKIDGKYNDLDSLYKTVSEVISEMFYDGYDENGNSIKKINECSLPVVAYSDTLTKLRNSNSHVKKFYDRIEYLRKQLKIAVNESDDRKAGEAVCKVLGEKFPLPEEDKANEEDSFAQ